MKKLEMLFVFIGLAIVMASLTIPLWWDSVLPYFYRLPGYVEDILSYMNYIIDELLNVIQRSV